MASHTVAVALSPDGRSLTCFTTELAVFDTRSGKRRVFPTKAPNVGWSALGRLTFSPSGN